MFLTVLTVLVTSPTASADEKAEAASEKAAAAAGVDQAAPAPAESSPAAAVTAPPAPATEAAVAGGTRAEPAQPAPQAGPPPDPDSTTEVGLERLPASAFPEPENRGIKYGSLYLTFHGLQWPYMPVGSAGSRFIVGVSGWGWVDNSYQKFAPWGENPSIQSGKVRWWKQQARLLLRVTPTYSFRKDWFVQGQAELVATEDQSIDRSVPSGQDTDDLWLRLGQWNKWDFQIGRFEGWEVFHLGMGLDFNTFERKGAVGPAEEGNYPISFYGLTDNQFRADGAAGNLAFHYYPFRFLRFEILGMAGSFTSNAALATRPVAILDLGWLKLKFGMEYRNLVAHQALDRTDITSKGIGGAIQFVFQPHIEFGANAAQGTVWNIDSRGRFDPKGSLTRTSFGGFANLSNGHSRHPLIFGLGALFTRNVDQNDILQDGVVDNYWHFQSFIAVQYVLFNQLFIKLVGGYARGHWLVAGTEIPAQYDDEMYSVRLRFSFYF